MKLVRSLFAVGLCALSPLATADTSDSDSGWYIDAYGGFSQLSDTSGSAQEVVIAGAGNLDVNTDSGFLSGMSVGYRYNPRWAAELAWEYRSNDSEVLLTDGTRFNDGNYASNVFYLNGYRYFQQRGQFTPYLGLGIGWIQEINLDLESAGFEQSYTGDGELLYQVIGGVDYQFSDNLSAKAELRFSNTADIDLDGEVPGTGSIRGLDYAPVSVAVGLSYAF